MKVQGNLAGGTNILFGYLTLVNSATGNTSVPRVVVEVEELPQIHFQMIPFPFPDKAHLAVVESEVEARVAAEFAPLLFSQRQSWQVC